MGVLHYEWLKVICSAFTDVTQTKRNDLYRFHGLLVSLSRQFILISVLAPTGELLSFASPKESIQRKGDPDSANFLYFSLLARVFEGPSLALRKRAASVPLPLRAYFAKSCDARGGITGEKTALRNISYS
ncbi:MAG: hypothetical protein Q8N35_18040 [Methylococcaceae bacterium]|nr:hypothetical protein [Methylococcaceae bacterium]MDZ4155113.1 hypothetical protein [Methylococcales bacterium]MDP2394442.1 hypothetical protein [Methylococcaceae bacterium]MDP3021485.1 hypothetical protein [Methylococcaceae bacterium]MDP3390396.1 hypothetical protein [Methylococcaceae bacterium]